MKKIEIYAPPILNKKCPTYKKLDYIFTEVGAIVLFYFLEKTNITISVFNRFETNSLTLRHTFTRKELEKVHPDVYQILKLAAESKIPCMRDTWKFWKLYTPDLTPLTTDGYQYETSIDNIGEPTDVMKIYKNVSLIVVTVDYLLTKEAFSDFSFFKADKIHTIHELTAKECELKYPELLKTAHLGIELGLSSQQILTTWGQTLREKSMTNNVCILSNISL